MTGLSSKHRSNMKSTLFFNRIVVILVATTGFMSTCNAQPQAGCRQHGNIHVRVIEEPTASSGSSIIEEAGDCKTNTSVGFAFGYLIVQQTLLSSFLSTQGPQLYPSVRAKNVIVRIRPTNQMLSQLSSLYLMDSYIRQALLQALRLHGQHVVVSASHHHEPPTISGGPQVSSKTQSLPKSP